MTKKIYIRLLLTFILIVIAANPSKVHAQETLSSVDAYNVSGDVIGNISLYEDYNIVFSFKYRVKDILVKICEKDNCEETQKEFNYGNNTVLNEEPYETLGVVSYNLKEELSPKDYDVTYVIKASADFKPTLSSTIGAILTINEEIFVESNQEDLNDAREDKILSSIEKVRQVFNKWIIPIIYAVLAFALVIKAILLSIDIVKHSDNPDIRREKLKAFGYLALVLLLIAALNTGLGFITGLFG